MDEAIPQNVLQRYSRLTPETARKTSDRTPAYNCHAFAAGELDAWWQPKPFPEEIPSPKYYWPDSAKNGDTVDCYTEAFQSIGYEVCQTGELEEGYEKIVFYGPTEVYITHTARQLPDGWWTSKLGKGIDIRHESVEGLRGRVPSYGQIQRFMRRKRS